MRFTGKKGEYIQTERLSGFTEYYFLTEYSKDEIKQKKRSAKVIDNKSVQRKNIILF